MNAFIFKENEYKKLATDTFEKCHILFIIMKKYLFDSFIHNNRHK